MKAFRYKVTVGSGQFYAIVLAVNGTSAREALVGTYGPDTEFMFDSVTSTILQTQTMYGFDVESKVIEDSDSAIDLIPN